ncbi:MAG: 3-hydroxyacyl-CoA dehydrogenase NAD-binding domain-containing protein [Phycisphaerales bacterium]|nr:3-hydroxyacyl-CoA dehydrogenase NAD-binding domain-containing protein [Phycisphaerales bacterium]
MPTAGILGAGAMGAGIAQVAAAAGWSVVLLDVDQTAAQAGIDGIAGRFAKRIERGRMTQDDADAIVGRISAGSPDSLSDCALLIEAIVEDIDMKVAALSALLEHLPADAIIASNTSSLSVTELGVRLDRADRTCGMHFFNPAPVMKLVEVVATEHCDRAVIDRVADIATKWGKTVAHCADTPGFIVNRVARPYYLEAFRCLEDGLCTPDLLDAAMRDAANFRMGPFELTDLIGHDVNTATTRSVWTSWDKPQRLCPVHAQEALVSAGDLGRKTGCGVYDHTGDAPVAVLRGMSDAPCLTSGLTEAAAAFAAGVSSQAATCPAPVQVALMRVLCGLFNEALWARHDGVADANAIDTAMTFGVNYPKGPFEWMSSFDGGVVDAAFDALSADVSAGRFTRP